MLNACETTFIVVYRAGQSKGFGAWLRSCINVCAFCIIYECKFTVAFQHNINDLMFHNKNLFIPNNVIITKDWNDLLGLKNMNVSGNGNKTFYISHMGEGFDPDAAMHYNALCHNIAKFENIGSNLFLIQKLVKQETLNFKSFVYTSFYKIVADSNINASNCHVIHLRFGDLTMIHKCKPCVYTIESVTNVIEGMFGEQLNNVKSNNIDYVLICDTIDIKRQLCNQYNFKSFNINPVHTMKEHGQAPHEMLDSILEFILLTRAKHITCINAVNYTSNFSIVASELFNIPTTIVKIRTEPVDICEHCLATYKTDTYIPNMHEFVVCPRP